MTEPTTRRTPEQQANFLLDLVDADSEFNDSEENPGWTSYRVIHDGSVAKLVITHESAEEDEPSITTTGTWILVPMGTSETTPEPAGEAP